MTEPTRPRGRHPTDTTDAAWASVAHLFPEAIWVPNLQEPKHEAREMFDAIRYRTRTGCAWRALPHDFPPWQTVARRFYTWRDNGVFDRVHDALRERVREQDGRAPVPPVGIVDSRSVKSTDMGGPSGFDAGKTVKGRKRHLLVDVLGLLLVVLVTAASVQDRDGIAPVLRETAREYPTLKHVWADGAYRGEVVDRARRDSGIRVEVVKRTDDMSGFVVLPRRWVVERTNGWLCKFRLLDKRYERSLESSRADVLLAMTSVMLRRLSGTPAMREIRTVL